MESSDADALNTAAQAQRFDKRVDIEVLAYRAYGGDPDNVCAKFFIDAIVDSGLLREDSYKEIRWHKTQVVKVKSKSQEKTVIRITEVE